MPNTGNTQQQINYGASANDGQGDPLRTAFIKTDDNFDNVWLAGPVGSNITIGNNTIQSNNTNGNIILKPNGTGIVQANASIIPNADNTRDLGSSALAWRRAYINELLPDSLTVSGDAVIGGNLTVQGDTIQIGNITTDTLTVQLANTAANAASANGAGITVGASDNIATILYNSTGNQWNVSIGISAVGNISAPYFIGNGSLLTGITGYGNANVANYLPTYSGNISAGNISVTDSVNIQENLYVTTGSFTGDATGDNSIYAGFPTFTVLGTDVIAQFAGNTNSYTQFNFQNYNSGNQASGDYVITADNGNDTTHFLNIGLTGGNWNGTQPNSLNSRLLPNDGYMYVQDGNLAIGVKDGNTTSWIWRFDITGSVTADGNLIPSANGVYSLGNSTNYWANVWVANNTMYLGGVALGMTAGNVLTVNGNAVLSNNSNTAVSTTGNITAGNVLTGGVVSATGNITANYFLGNGSQLTGLSASYSDANVATFLAAFGSNTISTTGNINAGNLVSANGAHLVLGNTSSRLRQNGSNATIALDGSVTLTPDTAASALNGVVIGGLGYLLAPDSSRNAALNYGGGSGTMGIYTVNIYGNTATAITNGGSNGVGNIGASTSNRFNTAFLITADVSGNITAGNVSATGNITGNTSGFAIGYRDIPQVAFTGNATIATADAGKHFYSTQSTDYILTIANNASQGFQTGAAITVVNQGTGNITVAQGSGVTLYLAGNATSGNRTVSTFGMATIMKVATDTWFINGTGVS